MLWFHAEDPYYYTDEGILEIEDEYKLSAIKHFPTESFFTQVSEKKTKCGIAPYFPEAVFPPIKNSAYCEVIKLPNRSKDGIRTSEQEERGIPINKVISDKIQETVFYCTERLADYGGGERLKKEVALIKRKAKYKIPTKGFLLAGIPGAGKSFVVKCIAGELGYMVVPTNLSKFKEMERPIEALADFFGYFSNIGGKYLIWIDEIEKMLKGEESQEIIGELLTLLNELNASGESSFFVIATANNIEELSESNPELFRDGRFDAVFFIMIPIIKDALAVFNIYIQKYNTQLKKETGLLAVYNCALSAEEDITSRKSRLDKIGESFFSSSTKYTKEFISKMSMKEFMALTSTDKVLHGEIQKAISKYNFIFNTDAFVQSSMETYREYVSSPGRYIYTPAEISAVIRKTFERLYLTEDIEGMDYYGFAEETKPLSMSLKDSINKMLGRSTDFIKI